LTDDVQVVFITRKERPNYGPKAKRSLAVHRGVEQRYFGLRPVQPSANWFERRFAERALSKRKRLLREGLYASVEADPL
jgi:hypothetical protein